MAVGELPGVEMSLQEQQQVIGELEEEVRRLNEVLEGIRRAARGMLKAQHGGDESGDAMEES